MKDKEDIRRDPLILESRAFIERAIESVERELKRSFLQHLDDYRKVELGLAGKGMKAWRSISLLYFGGFEEDAEIVLRSLVEIYADMRFISLDPEVREQRFRDYEAIHKLRWRRAGDRLLDLSKSEDRERLATIDADLKRDIDAVFLRQPQWANRNGLPPFWADEDTATKFNMIGEAILYFSYMSGCTHSHPNIVSLSQYFEFVDGRAMLRADAREPKKAHAFADACQFVHRVICHLNDVIHLEQDGLLKDGTKIVEALLLSRRGEE